MKNYNFFERQMLRLSYKPTFALNFLGTCVFDAFIREHQLIIAFSILLIFLIIGTVIAWKKDLNKLDASPIGLAALTFANKPIHLAFLFIGYIIFSYGSWLDNIYLQGVAWAIMIIAGPILLRKALRERAGLK